MKNEVSILIDYFALYSDSETMEGEEDLNTFKKNVDENYVNKFIVRPAERGGGNFIIDILINLSLQEYLEIIAGGVAYDLVKRGGKNFMLRPFLNAYREFRKKPSSQEIRDIGFIFKDTKIVIHAIVYSEPEAQFDYLEEIFSALSQSYPKFVSGNKNSPVSINIPIYADNITTSETIYRGKLDVDEILDASTFTLESYLDLWGLEYPNYNKFIYDYPKGELVKMKWYDEEDFYYSFIRSNLISKKP